MAIKPRCSICKCELFEPGAIVLGPPDKEGKVKKYHICRRPSCWPLLEQIVDYRPFKEHPDASMLFAKVEVKVDMCPFYEYAIDPDECKGTCENTNGDCTIGLMDIDKWKVCKHYLNNKWMLK